ncbi:unnamed protein product [Sphagnum balticum]
MSVDEPPVLDWEKGESVATGRILEGDGLRDVPLTEGLEGEAECGYVGVTRQDAPGIESTPEQNMESVTSTPAGEGVDDTDVATSSSSAQNDKFDESAEEELNTSNEPNPGLSLPLATELVSSELVEAGSHIPANSLNGLTKDLQGENTDVLPVLCTLTVGMLEDTLASQVHLETEAREVSEVAGVDYSKDLWLIQQLRTFQIQPTVLRGLFKSFIRSLWKLLFQRGQKTLCQVLCLSMLQAILQRCVERYSQFDNGCLYNFKLCTLLNVLHMALCAIF